MYKDIAKKRDVQMKIYNIKQNKNIISFENEPFLSVNFDTALSAPLFNRYFLNGMIRVNHEMLKVFFYFTVVKEEK